VVSLIDDILTKELQRQDYYAAFAVSHQMLERMSAEEVNDFLSRKLSMVIRSFAPKEVLVDRKITLAVRVPNTWQDHKKYSEWKELPEEERGDGPEISWKTISETYEFERAAVFPNAPEDIFGAFVIAENISVPFRSVQHPEEPYKDE
jgi:hypothetical protein